MRKTAIIIIFSALVSVLSAEGGDTHIIELKDRFYVAYINDIFMNQDDYIGRTLRIQGAYTKMTYDFGAGRHTVNYVYRNGPGCCGSDGAMCGFEFINSQAVPLKENDWIEVTRTLRTYEDKGITFLHLAGCSVKVLPERGNINVYN